MRMTQIIEALLFSSDAPLSADELARADESLNEDLVDEAIKELTQIYEESERAFEIKQLGGTISDSADEQQILGDYEEDKMIDEIAVYKSDDHDVPWLPRFLILLRQ